MSTYSKYLRTGLYIFAANYRLNTEYFCGFLGHQMVALCMGQWLQMVVDVVSS